MRIRVDLSKTSFKVPINYQQILQGFIYNTFDRETTGDFLHNTGYSVYNKIFKLFCFSNLFGTYTLENRTLVFEEDFYFYVAFEKDTYAKQFIAYLKNHEYITLNRQEVKIENITVEELRKFSGEKEVRLCALSPVVAYRTEENNVLYYKPGDEEFEEICRKNLEEKAILLEGDEEIKFEILSVIRARKRLVHFKNTFYVSYITDLKVRVNYPALRLLFNTGLSSKGSAGFGMVEVRR